MGQTEINLLSITNIYQRLEQQPRRNILELNNVEKSRGCKKCVSSLGQNKLENRLNWASSDFSTENKRSFLSHPKLKNRRN